MAFFSNSTSETTDDFNNITERSVVYKLNPRSPELKPPEQWLQDNLWTIYNDATCQLNSEDQLEFTFSADELEKDFKVHSQPLFLMNFEYVFSKLCKLYGVNKGAVEGTSFKVTATSCSFRSKCSPAELNEDTNSQGIIKGIPKISGLDTVLKNDTSAQNMDLDVSSIQDTASTVPTCLNIKMEQTKYTGFQEIGINVPTSVNINIEQNEDTNVQDVDNSTPKTFELKSEPNANFKVQGIVKSSELATSFKKDASSEDEEGSESGLLSDSKEGTDEREDCTCSVCSRQYPNTGRSSCDKCFIKSGQNFKKWIPYSPYSWESYESFREWQRGYDRKIVTCYKCGKQMIRTSIYRHREKCRGDFN